MLCALAPGSLPGSLPGPTKAAPQPARQSFSGICGGGGVGGGMWFCGGTNGARARPAEDGCDCGANDLITDYRAGDVVCRACGTVVESHIIDESPERYSEAAGPRAEIMSPADALLPDQHVFLDRTNMLPKRVLMANANQFTVVREGFKLIDAVAGNLFSQPIIDSAKRAYRDVREFVKHIPSTTSRAYAAGSLYVACKMEGVARSEKEIAAMCAVDKTMLTVVCKTFKKHLANKPYGRQLFVGVRGSDLLNRAIDRLGLERKVAMAVKRTAADLDAFATKSRVFEGKTPASACAGVVAVSLHNCCVDVAPEIVCSACNVAAATLARLVEMLVEKLNDRNATATS